MYKFVELYIDIFWSIKILALPREKEVLWFSSNQNYNQPIARKEGKEHGEKDDIFNMI